MSLHWTGFALYGATLRLTLRLGAETWENRLVPRNVMRRRDGLL